MQHRCNCATENVERFHSARLLRAIPSWDKAHTDFTDNPCLWGRRTRVMRGLGGLRKGDGKMLVRDEKALTDSGGYSMPKKYTRSRDWPHGCTLSE